MKKIILSESGLRSVINFAVKAGLMPQPAKSYWRLSNAEKKELANKANKLIQKTNEPIKPCNVDGLAATYVYNKAEGQNTTSCTLFAKWGLVVSIDNTERSFVYVYNETNGDVAQSYILTVANKFNPQTKKWEYKSSTQNGNTIKPNEFAVEITEEFMKPYKDYVSRLAALSNTAKNKLEQLDKHSNSK